MQQLQDVVGRYHQLQQLAKTLNYKIALVIMGTSDQSGNKQQNTSLSQQRASNTEAALMMLGLSASDIYAVGLGQIEASEVSTAARKVLFNVIYLDNMVIREGQDTQ